MKKLNENLRVKLSKSGGFTLVEMLIVVAIIAILIAVSIPLVNTSLERARESTDAANERAAVGMAMVEYMSASKTNSDTSVTSGIGTDGGTAYYVVDDSKGTLVKDRPTSSDVKFQYGKGTAGNGDVDEDHAGHGIELTVDTEGNVTVKWIKVT